MEREECTASLNRVLFLATVGLLSVVAYELVYHLAINDDEDKKYLSAMAKENMFYHSFFTIVVVTAYLKKRPHTAAVDRTIAIQEVFALLTFISIPMSSVLIFTELHTIFLMIGFTYNFLWHTKIIVSKPKEITHHRGGWFTLYFLASLVLFSMNNFQYYSLRQCLVLFLYLYGNIFFT